MHNLDLIMTLGGGLSAALVLGYITHRLGLSPIVGYLLAGVVVGPNTPGFEVNQGMADQMAEIGVILLMFGVGLHFHLHELLAVRRIAIPGAVGQSLIATLLGALVATAFGWDMTAGIVFGLAISVASTVVLTRVLVDNRDLHTPTGHIAIGWLVVEDLFTVIVLVLLPPLFGQSAGPEREDVSVPLVLGLATLKIVVLIAFTFVIGGRVIPWVLEKAAATKSRELFTLTVLVVVLGIAVGSAKLFDVSMALGAFLAGMVVGRSDFSLRAATEALPMRDAFAVLFFVSVGMLFDPQQLIDTPMLVAGTLAVVMIGKPLAALVIVLWLRYPLRVAIAVAVVLAQIGEFSFILADLAVQEGVMDQTARSVLVAVAILSITVNPILYRLVDPAEAWIARRPRLHRWLTARTRRDAGAGHAAAETESPRHRVIVVGYGPVGRTITRLLRENDVSVTVVELNLDTVRRLRAEGIKAVYGDSNHRDTLIEAGISNAGTLILSSAVIRGNEEVIRLAKEINPSLNVLARAGYLSEQSPLIEAGAKHVFAGEGEVALAMTVAILRGLGATPEQVDRERERIYMELFTGNAAAIDGKGAPQVATTGLAPVLADAPGAADPVVPEALADPATMRPDIPGDQAGKSQ